MQDGARTAARDPIVESGRLPNRHPNRTPPKKISEGTRDFVGESTVTYQGEDDPASVFDDGFPRD